MEIVSPVHGKILFEQDDIILFEKGIPGVEEYKKYIIKDVEDSYFKIMQSIEEAELGFIIISAFDVKKDYEIKLTSEILNKLEIKEANEVALYSIVSLNSNPENITANLRAPLIININKKKGEQYILEKEKYKIKEKVFNN